MAGISQEALKKQGRNLARANNQKSSGEPSLNLHEGKSDGGVIGRYKKKVHTSIKGGK